MQRGCLQPWILAAALVAAGCSAGPAREDFPPPVRGDRGGLDSVGGGDLAAPLFWPEALDDTLFGSGEEAAGPQRSAAASPAGRTGAGGPEKVDAAEELRAHGERLEIIQEPFFAKRDATRSNWMDSGGADAPAARASHSLKGD